MSSRLETLFCLLATPPLWPALGYGVAAAIEHRAALGDRVFATVIDAGAHKGRFAAFARWRWPKARLICFEPMSGPRGRLVRLTRGRAEIHACALGAAATTAPIHVVSRTESSSLLPLSPEAKVRFGLDEIATVTVPVRRLDACLHAPLVRPALLNLDVQGAEHDVLEGATALLSQLDAVHVRVRFQELYQGQARIEDIGPILARAGLRLMAMVNETKADGRALWADALFLRVAEGEGTADGRTG